MNFGDRERVIMPNGNGSSAPRRRERPNSKPALNSQDPYAVALCIDTLDPFDEVIRLSDLPSARVEVAPVEAVTEMVDPRELAALIRAEARQASESPVDEVPVAGVEAAVVVDTVDSRELADRIRAEARRWSESYVDEADQRATQEVAEQRVAEHPGVVGVAEIAAVADTVDSRGRGQDPDRSEAVEPKPPRPGGSDRDAASPRSRVRGTTDRRASPYGSQAALCRAAAGRARSAHARAGVRAR